LLSGSIQSGRSSLKDAATMLMMLLIMLPCVVMATKQVGRKGQNSTPRQAKTPYPKLAGMITSWMAPGMQNFVAIGSVSRPKICDFAVTDVTSFFVLGGSSIRPTLLNGFVRKIRQKTSFRARKCLLGSR